MSGKPSQELASDPGTVVLIPQSSSPVSLGGRVGMLKANGKGKANREVNLRHILRTKELLALPWIGGSWLQSWKCVVWLYPS